MTGEPSISHQNKMAAISTIVRKFVIQQCESNAVWKEPQYNESNHYENYVTNGSQHVSTTKSLWAKINGTQSEKLVSAFYVQRYGKRHLLGWSNVKQKKKWLVRSLRLSNCWVTLVWRHWSVRQAVSQPCYGLSAWSLWLDGWLVVKFVTMLQYLSVTTLWWNPCRCSCNWVLG